MNDYLTFAKAIADETRQEIMTHLCCVWLNVGEIVDKLNSDEQRINADKQIAQPTVSHHLKRLEEANLVLVKRDGKRRYYTLNQAHLTVCCGGLVRQFAPDYSANLVSVDEIPIAEH